VYSNLITKRDDLVLHEIPRLEALHMEAIGQLQYEEQCLLYDIALLKFERELNLVISRLMDAGKAFFCRIETVELVNDYWVKINAKIYMVE
jgi:hypothetical protein